jgi:trehalose-6-phosphate synthase
MLSTPSFVLLRYSQPVVFLHQDVSFSQYLALLEVADCFINASLREGMNVSQQILQ